MGSRHASSGNDTDRTLDSTQKVNREVSSPVEAEDSYKMSSQYKQIESDEVHLLLGDRVDLC
jgi:hypothetical protein